MDIFTDSSRVERLEIVDTGRRRRFSDDEKLRIVEESYAAPRMACKELCQKLGDTA